MREPIGRHEKRHAESLESVDRDRVRALAREYVQSRYVGRRRAA